MRQFAALTLALLLLPGCLDEPADGEPDLEDVDAQPAEMPAVRIAISAVGVYPANHAFSTDTLEVPAGSRVTLAFTNEDQNPFVLHDWALEDLSYATAQIPTGETYELTFPAPAPGEYEFVCRVGDHRNSMRGTFIVTPSEDAEA